MRQVKQLVNLESRLYLKKAGVHYIVQVGSLITYSILLFDHFAAPSVITDAGRLDYKCNFALVPVVMFTLLSLSCNLLQSILQNVHRC
jgi:hypothetical protein